MMRGTLPTGRQCDGQRVDRIAGLTSLIMLASLRSSILEFSADAAEILVEAAGRLRHSTVGVVHRSKTVLVCQVL